jgi:hypothetical protein
MNDHGITIVAEDTVYRVEIHEEPSMMYVLWKCHIEGEELKERFQTLLGIIKQFKPQRWLGNAQASYYTTIQDARWLFNTFIPNLIGSSITRYARVETRNSLMALDSINLQDKLNSLPEEEKGEFEFKFFTEEPPAKEWLQV